MARQTAFDLIDRHQSARPEGPERGRQASLRIATRIYANPLDGPWILLKLLRKDLWGRVGGIMAPRAQAPVHCYRRCLEPNPRKRDASRLGDRHEGLALRKLERYGIDDYRISCCQHICSLPAQRLIDAA